MQIYNTPNLYNYNNFSFQRKVDANFCNCNFVQNHLVIDGVKSKVLNGSARGNRLEYLLRVIGNKIHDLLQSKSSKELTKSIAEIKPEQSELYLKQLAEIGKFYGTQKIIDINIEDKVLEKLVQKGDSVIFIMNHSNQKEDPQMLAVLNTLLADTYRKAAKFDFPFPKIILNEDILKTMNPIQRQAFENLGAVGIDANVMGKSRDKNLNARIFFPLIKDFIRNKCNIFIFPEGRLAARKDLDLHGRFQMGVSNLINKILGYKESVTVVPVGFAYGKGDEKSLTAMHIGTPIEFKREGSVTTMTCGDIFKRPDSPYYSFFEKHKDETDVVMTSGGVAIKPDDIPGYLKTFLCENLEINTDIATQKVPLNGEKVTEY